MIYCYDNDWKRGKESKTCLAFVCQSKKRGKDWRWDDEREIFKWASLPMKHVRNPKEKLRDFFFF